MTGEMQSAQPGDDARMGQAQQIDQLAKQLVELVNTTDPNLIQKVAERAREMLPQQNEKATLADMKLREEQGLPALTANALQKNGINNVNTEFGPLYEVIEGSNRYNLTFDGLKAAGLDKWQARNVLMAIEEDRPDFLGFECLTPPPRTSE